MLRKVIPVVLFAIVFTILFSGCAKVQDEGIKEHHYTFEDDLKNTVTLDKKPIKVLSLMGSYGELWQLSGGTLKGVTEDAVSERNLKLDENVQIIGSVKEPNLEMILAANPDFVILSTDVKQHIDIGQTLKKSAIPHAYFKVDTFDDYLNMLKICTDINKTPDLYKKYGTDLKQRIEAITKKASTKEKQKVLLIRSMSTKAKALKDDHMVGKMLLDLNTDNIASRHPSLLEDLSMETIISENPDYIFVVTMGNVDKAIDTLKSTLMNNPAWKGLSAVRNDRFFILPKDLFQYKPNAKWAESYEYLEKIIYENFKPQ